MENTKSTTVMERVGYVGLIIASSPFIITGCVVHMLTIYASLCVSPIPFTIEYIGTGKIENTKRCLNNISNIDRIIYNNNVGDDYKIPLRPFPFIIPEQSNKI